MSPRLPLALLVLAIALLASEGRAVELQPYRAVYELKLDEAKQGSGILDLKGLLVLEWADACDGYKLGQRMGFRLTRLNAANMVSDIRVETLESKDGTTFRFNIRSLVDQTLVDEFGGRATLAAPGKGGTATFTKPRPMTVELPPGTVFPSEHTRLLVERAQAGDKRVARTVFEGSNGDTLYQVVAFLGAAQPAQEEDERHALLKGLEAWPVHIAFFPHGGGDVPEYEIGFRLHANGIGDRLQLDYGDFVIGGELTRLDALPDSGC